MTRQKILVVEPDALLLQTIAEKMLLPWGYTVLTAQDRENGLNLALSELPDLLLLHLPVESAANMLSYLAASNHNIPTILVVKQETAQIEIRFLHLGVVDYITLPILPGIVQDSVSKVLGATTGSGENGKVVNDLNRINKELEQYLREKNRLLKISYSINSELDFTAVLTKVTEAAAYITEAEEGYLILPDKKDETLRMRARKKPGQNKAYCLNNKLKNHDIILTVFQSGKTTLLQSGNGGSNNTELPPRFHTMLNAPLKSKNRIVGILGVKNYSETKSFSHSHVYQLSQLANIATLAIENSQEFDHTRKKLEQYAQRSDT